MLAQGENKISFRIASGLQVDVRLLEPISHGAALVYFTGSKEHNVALRGRANQMGYTLNEYANDVVYRIANICNARGIEQRNIQSFTNLSYFDSVARPGARFASVPRGAASA